MRVIMAGGGTGGHLFPGLSLAKAIEKIDPDAEVSFIGTSHGLDMEIVPRAGYFIDILSAGQRLAFIFITFIKYASVYSFYLAKY